MIWSTLAPGLRHHGLRTHPRDRELRHGRGEQIVRMHLTYWLHRRLRDMDTVIHVRKQARVKSMIITGNEALVRELGGRRTGRR